MAPWLVPGSNRAIGLELCPEHGPRQRFPAQCFLLPSCPRKGPW